MRLIDGDALIKKAYDEAKGMAEPYDNFGVLVEWLVDKSPTIELDFRGVNAGRGSANYCPNCGARMEESNALD